MNKWFSKFSLTFCQYELFNMGLVFPLHSSGLMCPEASRSGGLSRQMMTLLLPSRYLMWRFTVPLENFVAEILFFVEWTLSKANFSTRWSFCESCFQSTTMSSSVLTIHLILLLLGSSYWWKVRLDFWKLFILILLKWKWPLY